MDIKSVEIAVVAAFSLVISTTFLTPFNRFGTNSNIALNSLQHRLPSLQMNRWPVDETEA